MTRGPESEAEYAAFDQLGEDDLDLERSKTAAVVLLEHDGTLWHAAVSQGLELRVLTCGRLDQLLAVVAEDLAGADLEAVVA